MITDNLLKLSASQDLGDTNGAAVVSTDKVDLGLARDIGAGEDLYAVFTIDEAFTGGTSCQFDIVVTTDAALSAGMDTIASTGAIAVASLTLYSQHIVKLGPLSGSMGHRYLGANYTVVGQNTAGKVTTHIVKDIQDTKKFYGSGFSIT